MPRNQNERVPRVMAIAVHPFVTGQPHRVGALDAALEYICSHAGVWRALPGAAIKVSGGWHSRPTIPSLTGAGSFNAGLTRDDSKTEALDRVGRS